MRDFDFAFGFFSYLIDWFGFSRDSASSRGDAFDTYTINQTPIGG
jgi:hypothetical protein